MLAIHGTVLYTVYSIPRYPKCLSVDKFVWNRIDYRIEIRSTWKAAFPAFMLEILYRNGHDDLLLGR